MIDLSQFILSCIRHPALGVPVLLVVCAVVVYLAAKDSSTAATATGAAEALADAGFLKAQAWCRQELDAVRRFAIRVAEQIGRRLDGTGPRSRSGSGRFIAESHAGLTICPGGPT